ncbi:MAG: cell division protein FtsQ [Paludibacter sp.]|nr:cell division protein FtsQ [Paludibacter sp.]
MKAPKISHVFISLAIFLLIGYLGYAIISFKDKDHEIICKDLIISFPDNEANRLFSKNDISEILEHADLHPIGESYKDIQTEKIEKKLLEIFEISQTECIKTPSGKVYLTVRQRTPKFLIAGNECFYVDNNRKIMPVTLNQAIYLPVVSGYITKSMAEGILFDFVSFIEENPFWSAQIEQIYVKKNLDVELVPRVGNAVILMGKLDNFRAKLDKLKLLYSNVLNEIGWDRYNIINLQYENQIVCSKSDSKPLQTKEVLIQKNDTINKKL